MTLKELLIKHEDYKLIPYRCTKGKLTIGIGHNIDANGLPDDIQAYLEEYGQITDEMVDILFDMDMANTMDDVVKLYPDFDNFSENRQAALIDFVFNVGLTTARQFINTNKAINDERWNDAAEGFKKSLWYRQVGNRGDDIVEMIKEG
jgi:lysozyme